MSDHGGKMGHAFGENQKLAPDCIMWNSQDGFHADNNCGACVRFVQVNRSQNYEVDIEVWDDGHVHTYSPTSSLNDEKARANAAELQLKDAIDMLVERSVTLAPIIAEDTRPPAEDVFPNTVVHMHLDGASRKYIPTDGEELVEMLTAQRAIAFTEIATLLRGQKAGEWALFGLEFLADRIEEMGKEKR